MPDTKRLIRLIAFAASVTMLAGCSSASNIAKSPEEIQDMPAELQFEDVHVTVGDETASWLSQSSPKIVVAAFPGAGCDGPPAPSLKNGEIELAVSIPWDAKAGDVFELPSDPLLANGAGAGIATMFEQKHSFSFSRGLVVVDELTDERVKIRIDLASADGTKKARGTLTAPFCPDM